MKSAFESGLGFAAGSKRRVALAGDAVEGVGNEDSHFAHPPFRTIREASN